MARFDFTNNNRSRCYVFTVLAALAVACVSPTEALPSDADAGPYDQEGIGVSESALVAGSTLSAGNFHSCAKLDGLVTCWGMNGSGQLGTGDRTEASLPVSVRFPVSGAVTSLAVGMMHSCAVLDGGAYCWGNNSYGQLGDGSTQERMWPTPVYGLGAGVTAIAAGAWGTCAIVNGGLKCWGYNWDGQVGIGTLSPTQVALPRQVLGMPSNSGVTAIAMGTAHACAVISGALKCWGANVSGQLGDGANVNRSTPFAVPNLGAVTDVTAGDAHTCAVGGARLFCWGKNNDGQLGIGSVTSRSAPALLATISGVTLADAGGQHTCATTSAGLRCWGRNSSGQLGTGDTTGRTSPVAVAGQLSSVTLLSAGASHSCAMAAGRLSCWGQNGVGQLGTGTLTSASSPLPVTPRRSSGVITLPPNVTSVSAGYYHTCAVVSERLQCWGSASLIGTGATTNALSPQVLSAPTSGVTEVATGSTHSCAIVAGGISCWGQNSHGQLGVNSTVSAPVPTLVLGAGAGATAIAVGTSHTCAVINGAAWCWGGNYWGQLGTGAFGDDLRTPARVPGLASGVTAIAAEFDHTCAIVNGGVRCWGYNGKGQLGDGTVTSRPTPASVAGLTGATQLALGAHHSCALANGGVYCWGYNAMGCLGDGTQLDRLTPTSVSGLATGVIAIAAGATHSCALLSGATKCWGLNDSGQLGAVTTASCSTYACSKIPVEVSGLAGDATAITGGYKHSCALVGTAAKCWGANGSYGVLGNNSTMSSAAPVSALVLP